ncbi:MAG TPA: alpha/beta hydrolase [Ferruginibacter sp.]|nr:alpha/beta hydrolase [Ferruginibacter sp.]
MKLKNFLIALMVSSALFSCSKNSNDNTPPPPPQPAVAATLPNVSYGADAQQKMDIYLPANRSTATTKVMIVVHGGGWISGDKADPQMVAFIDTLKKRMPDYAIFNINYRLAAFPGTNIFPAQENDMKAAVDFVYNNRATYLVSDKFVLAGASAGGHLAALHAYKYHTPVNIKAVVDFCGPTDMIDMHNNPGAGSSAGIAFLLGGTPTTHLGVYQQSSPIFFANASSCPTIILQGEADLLVNANTQSLALKNKLGVTSQYFPYPGVGHVDTWNTATFTDAFNKIQVFLAANVQ